MISKILSLTLISLIYSATPGWASLNPADKVKMKKVYGLDFGNPTHQSWYLEAKREGRGEETQRPWYVTKGYLPALGGAAVAAPAPAPAAGGGGAMGGLVIDYDHDDSLRAAAVIILRNYSLSHTDGVYIRATFDLLKSTRNIPTKAEIERLYDSRLTPFIRKIRNIIHKIDSTPFDTLKTFTEDAIKSLPPEALSIRTVAASEDAQAVIDYIKELLSDQIEILKKAKNRKDLKGAGYAKRGMIINILYGGNEAFQDAASNTTPSMIDGPNSLFKERTTLIRALEYKAVMKNFRNEMKRCETEKFLPLIQILRLPAPTYRPATPVFVSRIIDRLDDPVHMVINGLITKHLLPVHAGAILSRLLEHKQTASLFNDLDKFIDKKPQEAQKKARQKYAILEALSKRQASVEPVKPITGRMAQQDVKTTMDNIKVLLENAIRAGEK